MCAICEFRIEFGIGHPLALSVAVATRKAIESGLVDEMEADNGALSAARKRLSAVDALNRLQASIEAAHSTDDLLALPDFYVLLIENDTWGFFHATTDGFAPDIVPAMPDTTTTDDARRSNIIVTSEAALRAWLAGRFDTTHALDTGLILADAPAMSASDLARMLHSASMQVV
ncbi:hypothetical protein [Paraburkholderia acidisoli]|uniref:hypothetical protein n=1 Tax=Paraburkholderia acidisoli TaxID=2571748 RepID=UPI001E369EC4|nr:hypothetical protein [Paraburkholderia acidisoli]